MENAPKASAVTDTWACVDWSTSTRPFNSNRDYEILWSETKEKRSFEDKSLTVRRFWTKR
jgi:hypothetical protein